MPWPTLSSSSSHSANSPIDQCMKITAIIIVPRVLDASACPALLVWDVPLPASTT